MTHLLKTIAISAVLVAATTTGLLTALSMMSQQTALAQAEGSGGGCGGNPTLGVGGGGTGFGVSSSPTSPLNHCGIGAGGTTASGGFQGGGSC